MTYKWTFATIEIFPLILKKTFKMSLKKIRKKKFTTLNIGRTIENLWCNLRRWAWVASLITFMRIMYCCAFKYRFLLDVIATFLINTTAHWPPLYVFKNYSYSILKWLPKAKTSWSNSPFPFAINNYFSPLLFPFPLTPTMMTFIIDNFNFEKNFWLF
jgi:hypothetical protein